MLEVILKLNTIKKTSFSITKTHGENITEGNKFVKLLYLVMKLMYSSFDYLLRLLLKVIFQN